MLKKHEIHRHSFICLRVFRKIRHSPVLASPNRLKRHTQDLVCPHFLSQSGTCQNVTSFANFRLKDQKWFIVFTQQVNALHAHTLICTSLTRRPISIWRVNAIRCIDVRLFDLKFSILHSSFRSIFCFSNFRLLCLETDLVCPRFCVSN